MRYIEQSEVRAFIGHEAITSPLPVKRYTVDMPIDSELLAGTQSLNIHVAEPTSPESIIIAPVPWSDYGTRPFQECRIGTMAACANARVICLDLPGMGESPVAESNKLSEKQTEELKKGRLKELAELYWKAMAAANLLTDKHGEPLPLALWGHSLSTLTVAELAASLPDGHVINDMYLSEPMALRRMNAGLLSAGFLLKGGKHLKDYLKMNTGMPVHENGGIPALVRQVVRQPRSHLLAVRALARGQQLAIVQDAYTTGRLSVDPEHGTRLHVVTASEGLVPEFLAKKFVADVPPKSRTLLQRSMLLGEGHAYQDSLPAVLHQMSKLAILR